MPHRFSGKLKKPFIIDLFLSKLGEENKSSDPAYCFDRTRRSIGQVAADLKRLNIHVLDGRIREWVEGQRGTNKFLAELETSQVTLPNAGKPTNFRGVIEANLTRTERKKILHEHVIEFAENWVK